MVIVLNLVINVLRCIINFSSSVLNYGTDIAHVVGSVANSCLEGFESHHNLSLHLDSLLVVILIPDLFVFIKVVDLFIKVGTWEFLRRRLRVIWRLVCRSDVEVFRSTRLPLLHLFGGEVCGASSIRAYGTSDSKFHNFIYMSLTNIFCFYTPILTNTSVKSKV